MEQVFFESGGIKVTNSRFMVSGQTYVMNNVTSVQQTMDQPKTSGPILAMIFGGFIALGGLVSIKESGPGGLLLGLVIAGMGFYILRNRKAIYHVLLRTASGETKALSSKDVSLISSVVDALNEAVVSRG